MGDFSEYERHVKDVQHQCKDAWIERIFGAGPWRSFITLTFRDEVSNDHAEKQWKFLLRSLNQAAFGQHYTRKVGHSYFGYVRGLEFQRRGVLHFHALIDRPIDFKRLHTVWNFCAGFAYIVTVDDQRGASIYLAKYITKGGELEFYSPPSYFLPEPLPSWWVLARRVSPAMTDAR